MEQAYHSDFGQFVNYEFQSLPDDSDGQVREAIHEVIRLIRIDARSEMILADALEAAADGGAIQGIWNLIKRSIRFKQDQDIADGLATSDPRTRNIVEVFIRPWDQSLLIKLRGIGVGDCDCFSLYGACLLTALGIPVALCTVAAERKRPGEFSHVYVVAYVDGVRIPLDFSHGEHPGWECPNLGRLMEWPVFETAGEHILAALTPLALMVGAYLALRFFGPRLERRFA